MTTETSQHSPPVVLKTEPTRTEQVLLTIQSTARVLDLSVATVRRLEKAGRLRFVKIGGRTLVCAKSLHALAA